MPTTTNNTNPGNTTGDNGVTQLFDVLANQQRRFALYYLTQQVGAVSLGDLADQIALWEGDHTRDQYERICTALVHLHLPKLADANLIRYDTEAETVELRETNDQLTPYLDLAIATDLE